MFQFRQIDTVWCVFNCFTYKICFISLLISIM